MAYEFRFQDCSTLVFYALDAAEAEIEPETPSRIGDPLLKRVFVADCAPYVTCDSAEGVTTHILRVLEKPELRPDLRKQLEALRAWVEQAARTHVAYQLEPSQIAGDGTARRLGLEREAKDREE